MTNEILYFRVYEKLLFQHLLTDDLVVITFSQIKNRSASVWHRISLSLFFVFVNIFDVVFVVFWNGWRWIATM